MTGEKQYLMKCTPGPTGFFVMLSESVFFLNNFRIWGEGGRRRNFCLSAKPGMKTGGCYTCSFSWSFRILSQ
jgi:hypothetical protein